MNVYLVPLGSGRFEPYFEQEEPAAPADVPPDAGPLARMRARFARMVRDAEEQRHARTHEPAPSTFPGRLQRRVLGWVAERVAEQRLLWQLRRADAAVLHLPENLEPAEGLQRFRRGLQKDRDRHLRLLVLHACGLLVSVPLVLVPGPNVLGYFFTFTVVGHFFAYRGARRGLAAVRWSVTPSPALTILARAAATPPPDRYRLIHEAAALLRLAHLARFVERMSDPPA